MVDHRSSVIDRGVDLTRGGVAIERRHEVGESAVMVAEGLEDHECSDQAAVGPEVVGEVVVTRVLSAEQGTGLGHHLLDERVSDPGAHCGAATLRNDLRHRLRADQVVKDRRAGILDEDRAGHHRRGE